MECKICSKKFSNGKALGGHMRSHYATLPLPPKTPQRQELTAESTSSFSFSFDDDDERSSESGGGEKKVGLRRLDPDDEMIIFDESTRTKGRMKRPAEAEVGMSVVDADTQVVNLRLKGVVEKPSRMEEDVALTLIMLSKDVWWTSAAGSGEFGGMMGGGHKAAAAAYRCERCDKVFKSSQGLGSHRSSHFKKLKNSSDGVCVNGEFYRKPACPEVVVKEPSYECPLCGKIFRSAQALGGHKRSHLLPSKLNACDEEDELKGTNIDLNLPVQVEEEDGDHEGGGFSFRY